MIQAQFTIPIKELTPSIIEKIKELLNGNGDDTEVVISVRTKPHPTSYKETPEEYFTKLEESIAQYERGEVVTFTVEEFKDFIKK